MKRNLVLLALALVPQLCGAESVSIPKGYEVERYEPIWKKSPFTLSSVTEEVAGGFAEKFVLSGILKVGKRDYVSVVNKDTKERLFLTSQPDSEGVMVDKVEFADDLSKVVVTLKKGLETSQLRYDPELLKQPFVAAPPAAINSPVSQPAPNQPNQPPPASLKRPARRIIIPPSSVPPK